MLYYMVQICNKTINSWTTRILLFLQRSTHQLTYTTIMESHNVRWAFNVVKWIPTEQELLAASSFIQTEEKQRISKFIFQDDAKSSLIGRLLMRKYVHLSTAVPYENIKLIRDSNGKPYLIDAKILPSFNVSHQGDFAVLAGSLDKKVGIDVMKIEPPVNKNVPDFFRIMNRQFSQYEWNTIRNNQMETQQLACLYRFWCLKESYVKNIGVGVTVPLNLISFSIKTPLRIDEIVTDTKLYVKNVHKDDWIFEETLLDEKHAVAVSIQVMEKAEYESQSFRFLNFEDLIAEARPLHEPDIEFVNNFIDKKVKEFKAAI